MLGLPFFMPVNGLPEMVNVWPAILRDGKQYTRLIPGGVGHSLQWDTRRNGGRPAGNTMASTGRGFFVFVGVVEECLRESGFIRGPAGFSPGPAAFPRLVSVSHLSRIAGNPVRSGVSPGVCIFTLLAMESSTEGGLFYAVNFEANFIYTKIAFSFISNPGKRGVDSMSSWLSAFRIQPLSPTTRTCTHFSIGDTIQYSLTPLS